MFEACKCHDTMTFKQASQALKDELMEFIQEPSKDEASDIAYCINRLAGSIIGKPYLHIVGGTGLHVEKVQKRMQKYGCIRSRRHLINGQCPSK